MKMSIGLIFGQNHLKTSFKNFSLSKNLSYMSLHAISVFDKVKNEALKTLHLIKSTIASKSEYASDQKYHTHFSPFTAVLG